jgi:hypothetical protein
VGSLNAALDWRALSGSWCPWHLGGSGSASTPSQRRVGSGEARKRHDVSHLGSGSEEMRRGSPRQLGRAPLPRVTGGRRGAGAGEDWANFPTGAIMGPGWYQV